MNGLQERLLEWLWTRLESPEAEVVQAALALSPSFSDLAEELGRYDDRAQEERRQLALVQEDLEEAGALLEAYHEKVLSLTETAAPPEERLEELLALLGSTVAVDGFRLLRLQDEAWEPLAQGSPSLALDGFLESEDAEARLRQCLAEERPVVVARPASPQGRVITLPSNLILLPLILAGGAPGVLALACGRNLSGEALGRLTALTRIVNQSRNSEVRLERLLGRVTRARKRLEEIPQAVVCLDSDGEVCEANAAAERLFGEDLVGLGDHLRGLPVPSRRVIPSPQGELVEVELHPLPDGELLALFLLDSGGLRPAALEAGASLD